jgi:DNA-binding response OmpR family regulator
VGATILLVEDDPGLRTLVRGVLERECHTVLVAGDGDEALSLACAHDVDLLVSDLLLPTGSARSLVTELQRLGREPPVLYISGYAEPLAPLPGRKALFLGKPFALTDLTSSVAILLED